MNPKVSVIIPAFNEEGAIATVVSGLTGAHPDYEIIVVDDGSTDATHDAAAKAGARVVRHRTNKGYGAAWKSGCRNATGDIVVFFDGDGQFDINDVARVLKPVIDGEADMASGARDRASHAAFVREAGKFFLFKLANFLTRRRIADLNCGLRAVRRKILNRYLHLLPDGFSASTTSMLVFLKRGYDVVFVPVTTRARIGTSTVRVFRDGFGTIILIIRIMALFDPLRIFLPLSGVMMAGAVLYSLFKAIGTGLGIPILGGVVFLGGMLIFLLGILCDQISALRLERFEDRN